MERRRAGAGNKIDATLIVRAAAHSRTYAHSSCLWQYSQSALIVDPSLALCESSWHRKQPFDVTWPLLSG